MVRRASHGQGFSIFSLRSFIVISFASLLALTVLIGGYAIFRINAINAVTGSIADEIKGVMLLGKMNELSQELRAVDVLTHNARGSDERRDYALENTLAQEAFSAAWSSYAPTVSDGDERAIAHRLRQAWQHFLAVESEATTLDRAGEPALADKVFNNAFRKDSDAFRAAVRDVLDYRHNRAVSRAEAANEEGRASSQSVAIALAIATILTLAISSLVVSRVSSPVTKMTSAMRRLADQDLDVEIPGGGRKDEIGAMAGAVQIFRDNAIKTRALEQARIEDQERRAAEDDRIRRDAQERAAAEAASLVVNSIGKGLERLAAGDLTYRLHDALPDAYEQLRVDLNNATHALGALIRNIMTNSSGVSSSTHEIARAAEDLNRRTEQQAASLEETAAALDEITATLKKTSGGSVLAREVVITAKSEAERSDVVVGQAVDAMSAIERSSGQISQIIGVIDEIAFQTNLLALNAGVEAARAGESGRGFAVVASEVRALAHRSAEAAKEIKVLISSSSQQVSAGVDLVKRTGHALKRILTQVGEIDIVVSEIAVSTQQQTSALGEVNTAINNMDQMTQQNAAMVEQSTAACLALANEAASLVALTEHFRTAEMDASPVRSSGRSVQNRRFAA